MRSEQFKTIGYIKQYYPGDQWHPRIIFIPTEVRISFGDNDTYTLTHFTHAEPQWKTAEKLEAYRPWQFLGLRTAHRTIQDRVNVAPKLYHAVTVVTNDSSNVYILGEVDAEND